MSDERIGARVRFIPSGIPRVSILRTSRYRMLITPTSSDDPGLEKVSLFRSKMVIYYDSTVRKPSQSRKEFAESNYVEVKFSDTESSLTALPEVDASAMNPPVITVSNIGLLAPMIKGTDRITTLIAAMKLGLLKELDSVPLPFKSKHWTCF